MLALSLGVAWLLLAPLSLWLLLKGNTAERVGAIVTLALLEGGTIVMDTVIQQHVADHSVVVHDVSPPPTPTCDERTPAPRSAEVGKALVLTWAAAARECETAEVTVRTEGRRLLIWLRAGPSPGRRKTMLTVGRDVALTLPVRVQGDTAAVTVPLPEKTGRIPVDGRTGRRIPAPAA
ncbi:hypothetical protein [Nonomuraea basaltis]|uniref:hypothetical protein n=1 Tax=Nonomuraea basaltis TaxID=2495887 RepID=UPI00110C5C60|nr:hypothetical protein [Nonomuraea basaltis]TMR95400.1 hypothetical protein EJK15_28880 [Nonomuraea basaltis]